MTGISDFTDTTSRDSLVLKLMSVEYTEQNGRTVVHLFCRDDDYRRHHIEVEGHRPSFYITADEHDSRVDNHHAVVETETHGEDGERYRNLHGEPLVRVYTEVPGQVAEMRELFHDHYEADVFYNNRWLIDSEVFTGIEVDLESAIDEPWVGGDYRVTQSAVEPLSLDDTPGVEPRRMALDIEVAGEGSVPDADRAEYSVSSIVAWDSYRDDYVGWLYHGDSCDWDGSISISHEETELDDVSVYEDESEMLDDFNRFVEAHEPDILTGWYSNDFDIPYLINRSRDLNVYSYRDWSPLGETYLTRFDPVVKGLDCVDMLAAYEKTQIHNLKSKALDDIAETELGESKVEHELDHTEMWRRQPVEFLRYNKVDVELVHRIDESRGCTELLDNLRGLVGCSYSDPIGGNIDMMDLFFLRKAKEYGYALPTAEEPDVGYFRGAYVYTPQAGLHEHVVYPDFSSLYPNMMYQCNISPETIIGTAEDLAESEYTEADCTWSYIDTATPASMKDDVGLTEGRMEKVYFLDPSVEEGFVRAVLDDIMGMCDEYTGGMYAATKRIRNSTYGVLGDSDSYGSGFRLFDWRLAEATTLGGRKVLQHGGSRFAELVDDDAAEVIYGDTDSVVTTIPNAEDGRDALEQSMDAVETLNEELDEYAAETFGLADPSEARMELEVETYARAIFFKGQDDGRADDGIKKRYVQRTEWDDDDGWLDDPYLIIKGFEYVRSDVAQVTKDVQYDVFEMLMDDGVAAKDDVIEYVSETITAVIEGDYDMNDVGITFGMSKHPSEYGGPDQTPLPQYRGAKYANRFIYDGDAIASGSERAMYYYIEDGETGPLRKTYDAESKEGGRYVDAVSVLDYDDMPDGMRVDRPKMVQKTLIDPLEEIFRTLDWGTEWLYDAKERATPPSYHRDEDQTGLDASNFM